MPSSPKPGGRLRSGWPALLAIMAVGTFYRFYLIDRLPPGDGFDPSYYGIDALQILRGWHPIFFPANDGREPLFSYLLAGVFALFGSGTSVLYATSAAVGLLTLPAVYWMIRELLADEPDGILKRYAAPLATLIMAVSYWHLAWSRRGVRAILVPLFLAVMVALLWRGLRSGSRRTFALCGLVLGVSVYTYQLARLLPVLVVAAFVLAAVHGARLRDRRVWLNLLLVALLSALVAAPLGVYAVQHPDEFNQRVGDTFVLGNPADAGELAGPARLMERARITLTSLALHGEERWRSTWLPSRPILDPFMLGALLLGAGVSLARSRRPAYAFVLVMLALMSAPSLLAESAGVDKRVLGALPAAMLLMAIGLLWLWEQLARLAGGRAYAHWLLGAALFAGIAYSAGATFEDYFVRWGGNPDLFNYLQAGVDAVGAYAGALPASERVYISPIALTHPSLRFRSNLRSDLKGYDGRVCMAVPGLTEQDTTWVIVPSEDGNSTALLKMYFPQVARVAQGPLYYGKPYFNAYRVPAGSRAQVVPRQARDVNWGGRIALFGYDLDARAYLPGETAHVTLYYRSLAPALEDYAVFVHLLGATNPATGGPLWAGSDGEPCGRAYPTSRWSQGEIVRDRVDLALPADLPAGDYQLSAGVYAVSSQQRLAAFDESGRVPDDEVILHEVQVGPSELKRP